MRQTGKQSRALRNVSEHGLATNALVLLACVLSIGLIAVSVLLNFRVAYRSADTEFDAWIYGLAAAMADGLKAYAPFAMHAGWRKGDWLAVATASGLFVVISCYTFSAEFGFAAQHRLAKQGERVGTSEKRGDVRKDYDRLDARIAAMGQQRSLDEIGKSIDAIYLRPVGEKGRTVDQISSRCVLNRKDSREPCSEIAILEEERARAAEYQRLIAEAKDLRRKLDNLGPGDQGGSGDPQLDSLQQLATLLPVKLSRKNLEVGLSVLVALFIELGSGVGLYIATTPWRSNSRGDATGGNRRRVFFGKQTLKRAVNREGKGVRRFGAVDTYLLERLEASEHGEVGVSELFDDYVVWCRWRGDVPYEEAMFARNLAETADLADLPVARGGNGFSLLGVMLRGR